jgi:hypothetical protein
MTDVARPALSDAEPGALAARVGWWASTLTAVLTAVTFGFAITALPNSGAGCVSGCVGYPYLDTLSEFPRDYLWMPLATLLALTYVAFVASLHACAAAPTRPLSQIGLVFAIMSATLLAGTYFVQLSVVPLSLLHGETEGIALLTQYNPHGVFIALEELGYLLMSLSFVFVAPALAREGRFGVALQWLFIAGFALSLVALVVISARYGLDRQDRFEIAVISIDWLVLLIGGALASAAFHRRLASQASPQVRAGVSARGS